MSPAECTVLQHLVWKKVLLHNLGEFLLGIIFNNFMLIACSATNITSHINDLCLVILQHLVWKKVRLHNFGELLLGIIFNKFTSRRCCSVIFNSTTRRRLLNVLQHLVWKRCFYIILRNFYWDYHWITSC